MFATVRKIINLDTISVVILSATLYSNIVYKYFKSLLSAFIKNKYNVAKNLKKKR